ncbi:BolA family protein [Varunaivibrio sulfuroxidans]|uniref:BolA protein family transcriptional regulator n=1 Tax=Varunaivibrio sulfuroxidans TaxID=1773489 RepID=A0A4V6NYJ4_9PROT|nr:BolA family protein [Varunaivibrio sulfuroxidans]TCS63511.1 BolA protein family transcriptional regulator [Varunaivibrio sulfuroxidans]WES30344.1 BolA family transcriptional regulator [Varunaivibrio sulfuroxidans]
MRVRDQIYQKLKTEFDPEYLDVVDESHKHEGHAGARPEGQTHFRVELSCAAFAGKNQVERQRMVYRLLADEMAGPVHALALKTRAPGE